MENHKQNDIQTSPNGPKIVPKWSKVVPNCPQTFKKLAVKGFKGFQSSYRGFHNIALRAPSWICEDALSEIRGFETFSAAITEIFEAPKHSQIVPK